MKPLPHSSTAAFPLHRRQLLSLVLVLALLASCRLNITVGDSPAASATGAAVKPEGSPGLTPAPAASPTPSGASTPQSAADALPALKSLVLLSATPAADFATSGLVSIDLLPTDSAGAPILNQALLVSASAVNDGAGSATALGSPTLVIHEGNRITLPWAVILDLDSSGSMNTTDPGRLRVSAAKSFVTKLLASRPGSRIAVADFGNGASAGFSSTRLLSDYSASQSVLDAAIEQAAAAGSTPLYESLSEMLAKLHGDLPPSDFQPMIFVFSDGQPTTNANTATLRAADYANATAWAIPVNAISLGDASVKAPLAELASQTGGIYADAADATALAAAFTGLVVARDKGYLTVTLSYPAASRNLSSSVITLTVSSGRQTGSSVITLSR